MEDERGVGAKHLLEKLPLLNPTFQPAAPPHLRGAVLAFSISKGQTGERVDNCTSRIQMQITQTCFMASHKVSSSVEEPETASSGCS